MDAQSFLRRVVGDGGAYCLFVTNRTTGRKRQLFFDDTAELLTVARKHDAQGADVYFALATFQDHETRAATNVHSMRSFYLDLDCGPDKAEAGEGYEDQATAIAELRKFCRAFGLPRPLLVNSGRGVHVYWSLDGDITPEQWTPVAVALQRACRERGFLADPTVTADAARILRIPGTHNHKTAPPAPVEVWGGADLPATVTLEDMAECLDAYAMAAPPRRVAVPEGMNAMQQKLAGNMTSKFRRILERTVEGNGCLQLGEMVSDPASVPEPLWRAGLSIAAHCSDGDVGIHVLSRGHPDYDPEETTEKAGNIKHGPYTCAKFDATNPGVCEGCPHWGEIKSPIVLGRELAVAPAEPVTIEVRDKETGITKEYDVPELPRPYVRGVEGGVYKVTEDDGDVEHVLIYPNDFYVVSRSYDKLEGAEYARMRLHLPQDGVREFMVPLHYLHSLQDLKRELGTKGITLRGPKQWENMGYYIMDWVEDLQMRSTASTAHRQFGWTENMESFLLGDREYVSGAVRNNTPTPMTQGFTPYFQPKGTLEEWTRLMEVYNQPGMEIYQLIMCASFGSALMAFMPERGLTIHLNSPTGYGKTTLQLAAQSVWGAPEHLAMAEKDTNNSKLLRLELFKNMLVVFDEMTNVPPAEVSDLLYAVTQGRQKNRMAGGANAERLRGDPWALIAISSGNASFTDKLDVLKSDASAEKERVFEIRMDRVVSAAPKADMTHFERQIKEQCYGHAGDAFIRYVVDNRDRVEEILRQVQVRLDDAANLKQHERFKSSGLSAALAAGLLAEKMGLLPYDMGALFRYTVKLIDSRRAEAQESMLSAEDHLADYLAENTNNILRIDSSARKNGDANTDALVVPDAQPRGEFVARYEPDVKKLYLMPRPLKSWCAERQINYSSLLSELGETHPVRRNVKKFMNKGTTMAPLHAKVTVIDMELPTDDGEHAEEG